MTTARSTSLTSSLDSASKEFCEFFAGIGLIREALSASGWQCSYANDIDPKKEQLYRARFGTVSHFHLCDVGRTGEILERICGSPILATASFPCVDLSVAGHYRGLKGGEQSSSVFGFLEVLESLDNRRPQAVLLENVPGFLTARNGEDFAIVVRELASLGYWLDILLLDASHFTPQSRPRLFVIGVKEHLKPLEQPASGWLWPTEEPSSIRPRNLRAARQRIELPTGWITFPIPSPPERTLALDEVIDTDEEQDWWSETEVERHREMMSELHRSRIDEVLESRDRWVGTIFRRIRKKQQRAEVRFDGLAGCLRTPKGGSAKQIVIFVEAASVRMRWMTPKEYARLQGAPDYPLVGTNTQQLWGFADAVCVPAVRWIDFHILSPVYDKVVGKCRSEESAN